MSPKTKQLIVGAASILICLLAANGIANEQYFWAILALPLCGVLIVEWFGWGLPEAWAIAVAIFGFIVGNRGFAQLLLSDSAPILPAEAVLAFAGLGILGRSLVQKSFPVRRDALNLTLLIWMGYATVRLPMGLKDYGFVALRDYALIYYASFFFLTQWLAQRCKSRLLLERAFTVSFLLLPLVVIALKLAPGFFLDVFVYRGEPLIFQKSDLVSATLCCGMFWFWSRYEATRRRGWLVPGSVCLLLIPTMESPRAAMVGMAVVLAAWLLSRRFQIATYVVVVAVVGLAVSLPIELAMGTAPTETKAYGMYERAVSIVDVSGTHEYHSADAVSNGDNNQFRMVWWHAIFEETMEKNPAFGLGFGYDMATRFLEDYDWITVEEDFTTRSPHSVLMTNLGRLGIVGLALFLAVGVAIVHSAYRSFRRCDFMGMGLWSICGTVGVSACFGVVLEGPMGAVVFWTALGLAHMQATTHAKEADDKADEALPDKGETALSLSE